MNIFSEEKKKLYEFLGLSLTWLQVTSKRRTLGKGREIVQEVLGLDLGEYHENYNHRARFKYNKKRVYVELASNL